jgi:hypothetical protein
MGVSENRGQRYRESQARYLAGHKEKYLNKRTKQTANIASF